MMHSSAAGGARPTVGPMASILVEPTPDVPIFKVAYANSPRPTLAAFASVNPIICLRHMPQHPSQIPIFGGLHAIANSPKSAGLEYQLGQPIV
eukprot:1161330-Pelagomonas_calceolata.AAC.2